MPATDYKLVWKNLTPGKISALGGDGPGDPQSGGVNPPDKRTLKERKNRRAAAQRTSGSVYVERKDVLAILEKEFEPLWLKNAAKIAFLGDTAYYCPPLNEARAVVEGAFLNRDDYASDIFDCDDYAFVLKGHFCKSAFRSGRNRPCAYAAGIVWFERPFPHAMNWLIVRLGPAEAGPTLVLVEPQTGEFYIIKPGGWLHRLDAAVSPAEKPAHDEPYGGIYFVSI
jgi:hypothetical protein